MPLAKTVDADLRHQTVSANTILKIKACKKFDSEDGVVAWAAGLTSFLTDPNWCPF